MSVLSRWLPQVVNGYTARELSIERQKMPLTLNVAKQSNAMWAIRKEIADWRAWSKAEVEQVQPLLAPVEVVVHHLRKNRSAIPDTGAPILAVKACIDGLVEAGVLPGDGPQHVVRLTFEAPVIVGYQGLRITLTETEGVTT